MNLHRALEHEWSGVPPAEQNQWQRLAIHTRGIITPGNVISVMGLITVLVGLGFILNNHNLIGLALVAVGRLADIFDGMVAHATKTKSPIGEGVDATVDKLEAVAVIIVLVIAGLTPYIIAVLILMHNFLNTLLFAFGRTSGGRIHPNRTGKLSAALEWITLAGIAALYAFTPHTHQYDTAGVGLYITFGASMLLAGLSTVGYVRQLLKIRKNRA